MADVFISYAQEDREQVRLLAETLERASYSVWWDRSLLPGDDFRRTIAQELDAAPCVIVCWSDPACRSRWVCEEADEALEQEKLVPVLIGGRRPPLGFRSVQYEDLRDWKGEASSEAWKRVLIQVSALSRGHIGGDASEAPSPAAEGVDAAAVGAQAAVIDTRRSERSAGSAVLMLLLFAGAGALLLTGGAGFVPGYWATLIGVAVSALALFFFADRDVAGHRKALVARWLLPTANGAKVSSASAFLSLFEAVFGQKHLTRKCFLRSALASCVVVLAIYFGISAYQGQIRIIGADIASFVIIILLTNIVGDYISLWETRIVLRAAARYGGLGAFVVLDFIMTVFICMLAMIAAIVVVVPNRIVGIESMLDVIQRSYYDLFRVFEVGALNLWREELFIFASFSSAFITSVWLWLALAMAPIFRLLAWEHGGGRTLVGRLLSVERAPIAALGYGVALLILVIGGALWGAGELLAAAPLSRP